MVADSSPSPPSLAVSCRNVVKTYGSGPAAVTALRGIDLDILPGELLMLVGPSGCGKTTLISVIAGILDRDAGHCSVFDIDFARLRQSGRTRWRGRNIGFVFQAFNLLPALTAAENAAIPLLILGHSYASALRASSQLLARVGLQGREKALPAQLSGGQQQRVAIARALVHNPRLVVCDEPTSALDHETGHHVMQLLRDLAAHDNRTLIIVTHDARIFAFADRIAKMDDGRIIKIIPKGEEI